MKSTVTLTCAWIMMATTLQAQSPSKSVPHKNAAEWPAYGRDAGGSRYSALSAINDGNIGQLKVAWTYRTGELETYTGTKALSQAAFEATPIMVGGVLYFSTPSCRAMAIDAATGKERWVYDPKVDLHKGYSEITSRGVSIWPAAGDTKNKGPQRIFLPTIDGRLIALDAATGQPVKTFGKEGTVDLTEGFAKGLSVTSPPAVIGNMIVIGSSMGDNQRIDYPPGTVRAFDAITGKLQWSWDPVPRDPADKGWATWKNPNAHATGGANAWSIISADADRGLVFIPTTCPSPDYYGGERLGQNLYSNSIVALRASTGKMVWHFQVVHHDLWDYDIAAQPILIEVTRNNKKVAAVAVGTKMGHIFIFNRETGEPLFPIEERPVAASTIKGEEAHPTQPFPVLPEPLGLQVVTQKEAWGLTPADKAAAEKRIALYLNKGIFTPPSYQGTIVAPGNAGGIHWGGMCYDPVKGLLITNINRLAAVIRMVPREEQSQAGSSEKESLRAEIGRQVGTPYIMKRDYLFITDDGLFKMQTAPPWGTLLAVDMNSGAKKWEVPLGFMYPPEHFPDTEQWGSINFGGAIVTAGNLVLVAATVDGHLRAFDTQTGKLLWKFLLPGGGQATPMTYEVNGKQYIVIAAGGHGKMGTKQSDHVMAFALP